MPGDVAFYEAPVKLDLALFAGIEEECAGESGLGMRFHSVDQMLYCTLVDDGVIVEQEYVIGILVQGCFHTPVAPPGESIVFVEAQGFNFRVLLFQRRCTFGL